MLANKIVLPRNRMKEVDILLTYNHLFECDHIGTIGTCVKIRSGADQYYYKLRIE